MHRCYGRQYCSKECRPSLKELAPKICKWCEKDFIASSIRRQFCSRECASKAHSMRMVGTGNSHFKGASSPSKKFLDMRPLILERDDDKCVACNVQNHTIYKKRLDVYYERKILEIHHIDHDPNHNEPHNLIALCRKCHMSHHRSKKMKYQWFASYAMKATLSMTSKWQDAITFLQTKYSSTTA